MAIDLDPTGPGSRFLSQRLSRIWSNNPEPDPTPSEDEVKKRRLRNYHYTRTMWGLSL